jgi:tetratricopeptide (TPR) repeat protein
MSSDIQTGRIPGALLLVVFLASIPAAGITWEFKKKLTPEQKILREADSLCDRGRRDYSRGALDSAEARLLRALKLRSFDAGYMASLGMVYERWSKWRQAVQWYGETVKAQPDSANMYYHAARLYLANNERSQALAWLEKYLANMHREAIPAISRPQAERVINQIKQRLKEEESLGTGTSRSRHGTQDTVRADSGK